ncbi:unnamed protein product [Blepharisma stoltei]|uniref:Uncharacterized protein n=1 Tax=Blepharisma stoltei TaxID=1481888 RepID=A0AAU9JW42_9CILI|nr:unnamed protein product [Blepharisma stoltei]
MDIAEKKFQTLKNRLDALHYCHPLAPQSVALVEALLNDLVKLKDDCQSLKQENEQLSKRSKETEFSKSPLQREVVRLNKEKNDLHIELMKTKEQFNAKEEAWRANTRKLEGEISDMRYLIEHTRDTIANLENDKEQLKNKVDLLLSKTYLSSFEKGIKNANLPPSERNVMRRVQGFEIERELGSGEIVSQFQRVNEDWAEELRKADDRAKKYQEELEELYNNKNRLEDELQRYKVLTAHREEEIERLSNTLGVGDYVQKPLESERKMQNETVKVLNDRIDYLNGENVRLEAEVENMKTSMSRVNQIIEEKNILAISIEEVRKENTELYRKINEIMNPPKRQIKSRVRESKVG